MGVRGSCSLAGGRASTSIASVSGSSSCIGRSGADSAVTFSPAELSVLRRVLRPRSTFVSTLASITWTISAASASRPSQYPSKRSPYRCISWEGMTSRKSLSRRN